MQIDVQQKLNSNKQLLDYLHTHSYWYKYLNRDPASIKNLENEYKESVRKYKIERASETLSTIEMLTSIVNTLK